MDRGLIYPLSCQFLPSMKSHHLLPLTCGLIFLTGSSLPADEPKNDLPGENGGLLRKLREGVTKALDKDGDGKISDEEKTSLKDGLQKKLLARYDRNKDGKLSAEEKQAMKKDAGKFGRLADDGDHKSGLLKKFDKNGDGKLDEQERRAAAKVAKKQTESKAVAGKESSQPQTDPEETAAEKPPGKLNADPVSPVEAGK